MGRRKKSFYKKVAKNRPGYDQREDDNISNKSAETKTEADKNAEVEVQVSDKGKENLYPNCDTSIWLRSCQREVLTAVEGECRGQVPTWLQGSLLRNGPGSLEVGDMAFEHLFDSSALLHKYVAKISHLPQAVGKLLGNEQWDGWEMIGLFNKGLTSQNLPGGDGNVPTICRRPVLHGYCIKDGKVTYQNRFLQSETYKRNHAAQRIVVTEFGTPSVPDPCHTIFQRVSSVFNPSESQSDNAMISIYPFGDELFAMTETPIIHQIDPDDLSTGRRVNLGKQLGIINHTSHPHVLPGGTVFNLGMAVYKTGPRYCIIQFPPKSENNKSVFEQAKIVATVPSRWRFHPSYMHTFGITQNYFIIVEQPLSVSVTAVVRNTFNNQPIASSLRWYEKAETKIYLISRKTGKTEHTFSADSFFYLHIINQFEKDGHVVLDICCYKDPSMLNCMYISALKEAQQNPDYAAMFRGRPLRFVLPLYEKSKISQLLAEGEKGGNINHLEGTTAEAMLLSSGIIFVKPQLLCSLGCETPRINYDRFCGKDYRYFYAISSDVDSSNPGMLIKVDTRTLTKKTWGEWNLYPSEPIFVPRPGGTEEDDGVILSAVVWGGDNANKTGIVILDATTWTEVSRTVFQVDGPVPKCLHGWFLNQ